MIFVFTGLHTHITLLVPASGDGVACVFLQVFLVIVWGLWANLSHSIQEMEFLYYVLFRATSGCRNLSLRIMCYSRTKTAYREGNPGAGVGRAGS